MTQGIVEPMQASREENEMWAEVESLPALVQEALPRAEEAVRQLMRDTLSANPDEILLAGCGDSHNAGLAVEMAFAELAGVRVQAFTAMAFSRYAVRWPAMGRSAEPLVIGISVSGEVARTIEAIQLAGKRGAMTVALTGNDQSRAARAARGVLAFPVESYGRSPGVRTYAMSLLALFTLAIQLGEENGHLPAGEAARRREQLRRQPAILAETARASAGPALRAGAAFRGAGNFVFIGSGPNYATALFGAAKVVEAAGAHVIGQDIEEWAHLQYFSEEPDTPTIVIAPPGPGHGRAVEVMEVMRRLGRRTVAITSAEDGVLGSLADFVLPVPADVPEMFSPLAYAVGTEFLAAALARSAGRAYFRQGNPAYAQGNGIRTSRISEDL